MKMKYRKYLKQDKGNNLTFLYFSISRKIQERACEEASYSLSRLRHRYSTRLHRFPLVRPALALTRRQRKHGLSLPHKLFLSDLKTKEEAGWHVNERQDPRDFSTSDPHHDRNWGWDV
jgi:hypothetical protein